jgi:hypothetical protein
MLQQKKVVCMIVRGELEENSKATFDINNHECNVITDTEDNIPPRGLNLGHTLGRFKPPTNHVTADATHIVLHHCRM